MIDRIQTKTLDQLRLMRRAGLVVAEALAAMSEAARPGVTTLELDLIGRQVLARNNATSSFLNYGAEWGYPPFPAATCISVNQVVVHGIPNDTVLAAGDLVSIDFGAIVEGWHGDAARSLIVTGQGEPKVHQLSEVTRQAMWNGIAACWGARRVGEISQAIQATAEAAEFEVGIVQEFTGHGIGSQMHMFPDVPNHGGPRKGAKLRKNICLAIEPIFTLGLPDTTTLDDEWTVVSVDGSWACHWENTVAICEDGLWVLTEPDGGRAELSARGVPLTSLAG